MTTEPTEHDQDDEPVNPLDLDLTAEAEEIKTLTVKLPDGDLVVPASLDDWPGNAVNLLTEGRPREAMEALVEDNDNPEDAELVRKLTVGQILKITEHCGDVSGMTPGKLNRSQRRSRRTGTKSRRTY